MTSSEQHDLGESLETNLRRQAKSGRVSYANPVLLRETSKSRLTFVPYFIPHTDHTELAGLIVTEKKAAPPTGYVVVGKKSVSLSGDATRALHGALNKHLKVAETKEDGAYLLIPLAGGTANLVDHEPAQVARALSKVLSEPEIAKHLDGVELSGEFIQAFRGAIRLREMVSAVAALRQHLDSGLADEDIYQDWCERHTWAFGNAYIVRDHVRNISTGDKMDVLLPTVIAGFRDQWNSSGPTCPSYFGIRHIATITFPRTSPRRLVNVIGIWTCFTRRRLRVFVTIRRLLRIALGQ